MKKSNKSVEDQIKLNNIFIWIMVGVIVLYAIIIIVNMVMQRSLNPMQSSMIACFGCIICCLEASNKKLKDKVAEEAKEKTEEK